MLSFYFALTFLFFGPVYSDKEHLTHGTRLTDESSLILSVMKRLGLTNTDINDLEKELTDASTSSQQDDNDSSEEKQAVCNPTTKVTGSIIKASESLKLGAKFLDSFKDIPANIDCYKKCCDNSTCDVAVYQNKGDKYCYLFRCDGKCIFKKHAGYFINTFERPSVDDKPEDELHDLHVIPSPPPPPKRNENHQIPPQTDSEINENDLNSEMSTTEGPRQEKHPFIAQHTIGLRGHCREDSNCEDPNAECVRNTCHCQSGYYNKDGLCRQICPTSAFECFELGTLSRGPECVGRDKICDGYLQCADGSDEFNCESAADFSSISSSSKSSTLDKNKDVKPSQPSDPKPKSEIHEVKSTKKPTEHKTPAPTDSPKKAASSTLKEVIKSSTTAKPQETHKDKVPAPHKEAPSKTPSPVRGQSKEHSLYMEKVIIASTNDSAEGPIIALSLGLSFTLILVVLLACRMRNIKSRLRKGRPLHQNEADYLINGMYL